MKKLIYVFLCSIITFAASAQHVIRISPGKGDKTAAIQAAIEEAKNTKGNLL